MAFTPMGLDLNLTIEGITSSIDQGTNVLSLVRDVPLGNGLNALDETSVRTEQTVLIGRHRLRPVQREFVNAEIESLANGRGNVRCLNVAHD